MTAKCLIEGFRPAILLRDETPPLKWQPRDVSAKALAHLGEAKSRAQRYEKVAAVNQCASDFLNILDIFAGDEDPEKFLAEKNLPDSLYFAIKAFKNTCGFASIDVPENVSLANFARFYAEPTRPVAEAASIFEGRLF